MTRIDTKVTGSVMTITLNGPERMNSLSPETLDGLNAALDAAERDDSLSSLVITGTGRAFCVGMDIGFLGDCFADPPGVFLPFIRRLHAFLDRLEACPLPSVAAINGLTRAGGFELLLACDFVIAADDARVGDTHSDFGVVPGAGASQRAPRKLGDQRARALLLAGRWLTGPEMVDWGLALASVPPAELPDEVTRLTDALGNRSRAVTAFIKRLLNAAPDVTLEEGLRLERELFTRFHEEVADADEGYRAYVEKRRPVWNGR
ncbi:enoyl-CoA hydratase/isomerase family protein [Actinomadura sp. 6K520]|jgi:enoyl-CoA hydratase/carnithine racemase|uniref:enoyl-CoA hydratase/isomerase family protein n=1 Tax=Actinomadura sp. 6K520 TaxID=2530364 RepID=UPI00104A27A7|nr:enoyl-CoA hydratase/isomerase family protein [Actinomadura sp. 6K520]TDE39186.1 enoyl-CoA hydratase/isomerase family protein [Actinomadura sp. 6K520]